MFKLDMDALREDANELRLMANPANLANRPAANDEPEISHKPPELAGIAKLAISHESPELLLARLMAAAMRACDHWGDSEKAREEMRTQCLEIPHHLREDLLNYFNRQYLH